MRLKALLLTGYQCGEDSHDPLMWQVITGSSVPAGFPDSHSQPSHQAHLFQARVQAIPIQSMFAAARLEPRSKRGCLSQVQGPRAHPDSCKLGTSVFPQKLQPQKHAVRPSLHNPGPPCSSPKLQGFLCKTGASARPLAPINRSLCS